jgi:P-type Mg2+ transporter
MLTTALVMGLGIYVPFSPLGALVGPAAAAVGNTSLGWQVPCSATAVVAQLMKRFYIRRFGEWL